MICNVFNCRVNNQRGRLAGGVDYESVRAKVMSIFRNIIGWSLGLLLLIFSLIGLRQGFWPFLLLITAATLVIPLFDRYRKKIKLTTYPALFIGSVMGFIGINGIKFEELEEAGNKISTATAQIEHAEPAKEPDIPEISNAEPEANTLSDAEIAAAMATILRDARAEKTVLAASWQTYPTGARILVAEVADNGTKRDGFAEYLCLGVRSANIPHASVTIVRDLSRGPLDIDNILGIQSCF